MRIGLNGRFQACKTHVLTLQAVLRALAKDDHAGLSDCDPKLRGKVLKAACLVKDWLHEDVQLIPLVAAVIEACKADIHAMTAQVRGHPACCHLSIEIDVGYQMLCKAAHSKKHSRNARQSQ